MVTVSVSYYFSCYSVCPAGFGNWIFKIDGKNHWFENMNFDDAKEKARLIAAGLKVKKIFVMP